jgi:hypothetical protein
MDMLENGYKGHSRRKPPGKRKHNHVIYVLVLAFLTVVVYYTKRTSYTSTFRSIHDKYLSSPALRVITPEEKKGGWAFTKDVYDHATRHPNANVISLENPRLIHFPSFMTHEEADHLMGIAKNGLHRSMVVADKEEDQKSDSRTSFGMWPPHDEFSHMIEDRIHRLVGIPHEFGEGMYVLNYKQGQEYKVCRS